MQETSTGQWFQFSDTEVEQLAPGGPAKLKGFAKAPKGHQSSNAAYMLVYTEKKALAEMKSKVQTQKIKTQQ